MAPLSSLPDFGLNTDDVRYLSVESVVRGRGPERLKFLDLEGHWTLSGKSIPFISAAFNHLERLNDARFPFRDIAEEPINAIGMVGWTPSSEPARDLTERRAPAKFKLPVPVLVEDEVPPSPRERMPHRSAGYGPAHQKRKLSIPDRSRSASPMRQESPIPTYDRYAKYERNRTDSMTRYGTKWGADAKSGAPSPKKESADSRPPHRTPALSPRIPSSVSPMARDTGGYLYSGRGAPYKEELRVMTREQKQGYIPYRSAGYGAYHEKRQYELSPRSLGSAADYYTSGSEQSSPASMYDRNADDIMMVEYHSRRTTGTSPRRDRTTWVH
ncbi:hypothetical protein Y032_0243g3491 [Ancylostoma ceylanicum]|uniref:Uncharacterized protein n=1 Tax=Ancylostoma ceylanicum TaxID=53326 RepID=A0A016SE85_9BILA|nr:hypothetical protein Y032_0243g3491 [Ancylostoma ceylanicum]